MKKNLFWVMIALLPMLTISCGDNKTDDPDIPTQDVASNIVGKWLLSTSDAENWILYEFKESSRINVEITQKGYYGTGTGYYSIENDKFSGSYNTDRNQTFYVDWIVTDIKPFEIGLKIYDENTLVGNASIYRVVSNVEVETGTTVTPDYRGYCGTSNISNFNILDNTIAEVDNKTGEITCLKEGITFITFNTPNGKAALKVNVIIKKKTFAEMVTGIWIYDNYEEKTWERYHFLDNEYVYVEWESFDGKHYLGGSEQALYTIENETVTFTVKLEVGQMNMKLVTESINDLNWTYSAYDGTYYNGRYTAQKQLESVTLSPEGTITPDYQKLVGNAEIKSYKSHNNAVATVNASGEILARAKGRTYIDIVTNKGVGLVEVVVDGGAIPVAFEKCIGKGVSQVYELLGDKPYFEDNNTIIYKEFADDIETIGVSMDSKTRLVKGITVTYKSTVNVSQVTSILDATFVPYLSQTTDVFKAYMDTEDRADATIGVTWNITKLTLTYVNLATDLFTDYSILIGRTKSEVMQIMGREPDSSNNQSQNWYFYDKKGVIIVSAYYTDFVNMYDYVRSVVTMLDETLTVEQVTNFLKKKYPYYPEYSSDEELVFIPDGHAMEIFYRPKDKMIMYISTTSAKSNPRNVKDKVKMDVKSIKNQLSN